MTTVTPLALGGIFEITPKKFGDDRGFSPKPERRGAGAAGIDLAFVQDNRLFQGRRDVPGLHYQAATGAGEAVACQPGIGPRRGRR